MEFADRVVRLKPSLTLAITAKAKAMKRQGLDVVGFGAGEPDFDTPSGIKRAGIRAIEKGFTKYTPVSGTPELKKAIAQKLNRENGLSYTPEEIVVSCGAKHALYNIFQVLCGPGDEVIIVSPYWVSYPEMVKLSGATPRIVEAKEKNSFVPEISSIRKAITKHVKAIIVNSPSNPTGATFGKPILEEVAKIAVLKKLIVISDEIYEELIYDGGKHVSIGSINSGIFKQTITVNGFSKTFSMTGWRIGYAAGPGEIMRKIAALQSHSTSNPASISQKAAVEALERRGKEVGEMKKKFAERRDYMSGRINSMEKISCVKPRGAFYIFCNITETGLDSLTFAARLLDEAHVACVPGIGFGSDTHVRLSFATSLKNIKKGLDRMEKWLQKL